MLSFLDKLVNWISRVLVTIAGIALMGVVVIVMAEVIMRALRTPLVGGIELIRVSFLVSVFFAFAHVLVAERDIRVDVIRALVPVWMLRYLDVFATVVSALFFGMLFYFSLGRLHEAIARGVYLEGRLLLPMWIPWGTIVIGAGMAVVAAVTMGIRYMITPPKPVDGLDLNGSVAKTN